jgi:hypothetical protein
MNGRQAPRDGEARSARANEARTAVPISVESAFEHAPTAPLRRAAREQIQNDNVALVAGEMLNNCGELPLVATVRTILLNFAGPRPMGKASAVWAQSTRPKIRPRWKAIQCLPLPFHFLPPRARGPHAFPVSASRTRRVANPVLDSRPFRVLALRPKSTTALLALEITRNAGCVSFSTCHPAPPPGPRRAGAPWRSLGFFVRRAYGFRRFLRPWAGAL